VKLRQSYIELLEGPGSTAGTAVEQRRTASSGVARILDEADPYAVLAETQQRNHELKKARNSYLEASLRSSERQQQYLEQFVRLSLKTGTPSEDGNSESRSSDA
jgi:hypothetical protein